MLTRKEQLAYCKMCTNRYFDKPKGVVYSLTGEYATFEVSCNDYNEDPKEIEREEKRRKKEAEEKLDKETWGLSSIGITNLVTVGVIFMVIAIVAEALIIYYFNRISLYPVILFILAIISVFKGISRNKQKKASQYIVDSFNE